MDFELLKKELLSRAFFFKGMKSQKSDVEKIFSMFCISQKLSLVNLYLLAILLNISNIKIYNPIQRVYKELLQNKKKISLTDLSTALNVKNFTLRRRLQDLDIIKIDPDDRKKLNFSKEQLEEIQNLLNNTPEKLGVNSSNDVEVSFRFNPKIFEELKKELEQSSLEEKNFMQDFEKEINHILKNDETFSIKGSLSINAENLQTKREDVSLNIKKMFDQISPLLKESITNVDNFLTKEQIVNRNISKAYKESNYYIELTDSQLLDELERIDREFKEEKDSKSNQVREFIKGMQNPNNIK